VEEEDDEPEGNGDMRRRYMSAGEEELREEGKQGGEN
jgi:hypothetical protein